MKPKHVVFLLIGFLVLSPADSWSAPKFKVLYSFTGGNDGGGLWRGVTLDKKGNLYGTTTGDGPSGYGTVFKLKHHPDGSWTEKVLFGFSESGPEGDEPYAGVTIDEAGNLYGTTIRGGTNYHGVVFKMSLGPDGWHLTVLYNFCSQPDCSDGGAPQAGLVMDAAGNLYGTAFNVFELTPGPSRWIESVLYDFCSKPNCADGRLPYGGLIRDGKGNLYGMTYQGGAYNFGAVYKVKPLPDGTWEERVLHSFGGFPGDGKSPGTGNLFMDDAGNLYGTTDDGGKHICINVHCGVVFKLTRQPNGHWKETIVHDFRKVSTGFGPNAGVVMDQAGNLYGTAAGGSTGCSCGVVYKLSPNPDGTWSYSLLHQFNGSDGAYPNANLILDDAGNLYGTTILGGPGGAGVVFELTP